MKHTGSNRSSGFDLGGGLWVGDYSTAVSSGDFIIWNGDGLNIHGIYFNGYTASTQDFISFIGTSQGITMTGCTLFGFNHFFNFGTTYLIVDVIVAGNKYNGVTTSFYTGNLPTGTCLLESKGDHQSTYIPYMTGIVTTVALLPSPGIMEPGTSVYVTDATSTTFRSIVAGGGSNFVPVFTDGSSWLIG